MKSARFISWTLFSVLLFLPACNTKSDTSDDASLKNALSGKYLIGTALNSTQIYEDDTASVDLIKKHFNSIVAENCMKSEIIQPEEGVFNFSQSDVMVDFGEKNKMYIVGHCLIWHSQVPDWMFMDANRRYVSRELLIERMKTHITTLVERYKGRIDCWDVVNEAFLDDGSWRRSKFYDIIGPEYIQLAFQFAHEADPDAELIYNDYSMDKESRRISVVELVKSLKEKGVKIDGVGMQAHSGLDYPSMDEFEKSIEAFAETGVDVHITELDISLIPVPEAYVDPDISGTEEYKLQMDPYTSVLPDSISMAQHDRYLEFFKLFLKHQDKIKRVTVWGVTDDQSWRNYYPIMGRTDFPLLFDRRYAAKPVVADIISEAKAGLPE